MFRSTVSNLAQLLFGLAAAAVLLGFLKPDAFETARNAFFGDAAPHAEAVATEPARRKPGMVALTANAAGHFEVDALIDGRHASLMADTGASMVALTYEDAERLGLRPHQLEFNGRINTANGEGRFAATTLKEVTVGPITVRDVEAVVAERGKLHVNLLGMSFIGRISRFELKGDQLILHR